MAYNYIRSSFLTDIISIIPYSVINPKIVFLRYCKLSKFRQYQGYFDEFFVETMQTIMERNTMKQIIDMWDLIEKLCFVSHISACVWMYIGYNQLAQDQGWIFENNKI